MMADYDSNIIKPVEGLHSITGLTPAKRREERNRKQQLKQQSQDADERQLDQTDRRQDVDDSSADGVEGRTELDSESQGIDYCA
jgi:hypothetical protein